jgi:hypothetical protein
MDEPLPGRIKPRMRLTGPLMRGKVDRTMRKLQLLGLLLVAMIALGAVIAVSASAETTLLAEWLINGAAVTTLMSFIVTTKLLLEDLATKEDVRCITIIEEGSMGPNGEKEITENLTSGEVAITLAAPMLCKSGGGCEASTTDVEYSPESLPWHGLLFLSESGTFLELVGKATYVVSCLVLDIKVTDECTSTNGTSELINGAKGVEGKKEEEVTPDGSCSVGGAGELTEVFLSKLILPLTGSLTISE